MGCTTSKLDDLPAVELCRDRCTFLEAAIHQRYAFADAHLTYTQSLKGIGQSLHHFINLHHRFVVSTGVEEDYPEVKKKTDPEDDKKGRNDLPKNGKPTKLASTAAVVHSDSGSRSGHIEFDSDSDDDIDSLHHSDHLSPLHHHLDNHGQMGYMDSDYMMTPPVSYSGRFMHMNYMKNSSMPPSVIYEQRPSSPQRVYFGESNPNDPNLKNTAYPYFPNYGPGPGPGPAAGPVAGFYGYGSSTTDGSFSKPPPGPPSPPKSTPWDFLNPFETFYPPYTPSRDSRELREEEGIPDLEDEDFRQEVVKEVQGKEKFAAAVDEREELSGSSGASTSGASLYQTRPSVSVEKEGMEFKVHVVEKKVVEDGGDVAARGGGGRGGGGRRGVSEAAKEIEAQFLRAAESGSEVAKLLEVGKHPYGRKHVSSKMSHGVASSPSKVSRSSTTSSTAAPTYADIEEELASKSRNLSSTLHKIHLWEKKLYDEVKAEEKLQVTHEKNLRRLKRLDERGAESNKVDSTRKLVRSLSTKIRIAIQVVDKISITINKIRDEELWLQLNELIQGLTRMWKAMFICHQTQCEAIREVKGLGPIRASKKLKDDYVEATRTLSYELIDWILGFSSWVIAQKRYVKELNSWLKKCLHYEPEETPDGFAPFSPGRMGAPVIFVICNQWEQALDRVSEKEVIEAMRSFTTSVLQVWEQDSLESRGHGESETRGRNMDREEQRIQKEIQELERKMVNSNLTPRHGNVVYQSDTTSNDSLQGSLQRIFEALESFMSETKTAYEDLSQRVEEECSGREAEE